jgi:hypothetical protein
MQIQFGVGTAENPYVKFKFDLPASLLNQTIEKIDVTTLDNEGKSVTSQFS